MSLRYQVARGTTAGIAGNADVRRLFWDHEASLLKLRDDGGTLRVIGPFDPTDPVFGVALTNADNIFRGIQEIRDGDLPGGGRSGLFQVILLDPPDAGRFAYRVFRSSNLFGVYQDGRVVSEVGYDAVNSSGQLYGSLAGNILTLRSTAGGAATITLDGGTGVVTAAGVKAGTGATVTGFGDLASQNTVNLASQTTGILPASALPDIAIIDFLGSVANQTAMLALTGQKGDFCIRTDSNTVWVITGNTPSSLASWTQLAYPGSAVTSVAGKTGAVTLVQADVSGLTTADSPQFAALNIGHATDTTITRASAGRIAVEGGTVLLASDLGSTVQAYDADLAAIAAVTSAADKGVHFTGSGTAATHDLTGYARSFLAAANEAAARNTAGVTRAAAAGGRLTLTSGTAVTATDVTGASTLYYTACTDNTLALYSGSRWAPYEFTEFGLSLSSLTSGLNYDVFGYPSGGSPALELTGWSNNTARATALARQDGVWVKSGDATRRYLGTIRATGTTTTEDSDARRFVWNVQNRRARRLFFNEATSHTYGTATWREWRGGTGGPHRVEFVAGLAEDAIDLVVSGDLTPGSAVLGLIGTGLDSTTVPSFSFGHASAARLLSGRPTKVPPQLGYHYFSLMEFANGSSVTFTNGYHTRHAICQ